MRQSRLVRRGSFQRLAGEAGFIWWIVVVVVVVIALAAAAYLASRPGAPVTQPVICQAGELDVRVKGLVGARPGQNYTISTTVTRRCDAGQSNCQCGNTTGSFGTPTTPCDSYAGNVAPAASTDTVAPAAGVYTTFTKQVGNLREGVYQVTVVISVPGQPSLTKQCCVVVKSGQTSALDFGCDRIGLPGSASPCADCAASGSPTIPIGPIGTQPWK